MSSRSTHLAAVPRTDDFNPTLLEPGTALGPMSESSPESSLTSFAFYIPDEKATSTEAFAVFGELLPESVIRNIIAESEEIAHSTRKIIQEHMRMGGNFLNIKRSVESAMVAKQGDKKSVRDRAAHLVYQYIERLHRIKHQRASLYMRAYEKFVGNDEAMALLTLADMQMLVAKDTPDELIDKVMEARRDNPDMRKREVKALIDEYYAEKDEQLQVANDALSIKASELDEAYSENKRLTAQLEQLQQDIARDRKASEATKVELKSVSNSVSVLNQELAKRERDLEDAHRALVAAESKVQIKEVQVEVIPEAYLKMDVLIEEQIARKREVEAQLQQAQAQLAEIEQRRAQQEAQLQASERLEKQVKGLIERFAAFTQEYHTAQLMVTADGRPERFKAIFQALADIVGKFHVELTAAASQGA